MRALFKLVGLLQGFAVIVFLAASTTAAQAEQLVTPAKPDAVPGVTTSDSSPCADTDVSCWKHWSEIAKHGCLLIGSSPMKAVSRCMGDALAIDRVEQTSAGLADVSVRYSKSGCPRDDAKEYCSQVEMATRHDNEVLSQQLHTLLSGAQESVQMLKCRLNTSDEADLANCHCAGKPDSCKVELANEFPPECYRPVAGPDVWKCLCRKHFPAEAQSEDRMRACMEFWIEADKKAKVNERFWNLKCVPGNYPAFCGEGNTFEARCLAQGTTCCGDILCSVGKKCMPISPDPLRNMGLACVDADIEYCAGIGLCPKGTRCWTFGGKPACLPPETDVCETYSDCGFYGPHVCTSCCPRYHSHPVHWPEASGAGWCIAHCECAPGPAPGDKVVSTGMHAGAKMTIEFTGGSSSDFQLKTAVLVIRGGKSASSFVDPGYTSGGCAVVVVNVARQVGVPAELEGLNKVALWGSGVKVSITNGCTPQCSAPNCSN